MAKQVFKIKEIPKDLKSFFKFLVRNAKAASKDIRFWTKFVCWALNILTYIMWRGPNIGWSGMLGQSQCTLWLFTVPTYLVVLSIYMIKYLIDEQPSINFNRVFLFTGAWLFGATGIVGIFNGHKLLILDTRSYFLLPILQGVINLIVSVVMFVDDLMNEHVIPTKRFSHEDKKDAAQPDTKNDVSDDPDGAEDAVAAETPGKRAEIDA